MMRTVGFLISHKSGEKRRALLPEDLALIRNVDRLYFETGYGDAVFRSDGEYREAGAAVVSRREALNCDVLCDVKLGDADYLDQIGSGKLLFGWAHAVQNTAFTTRALLGGHTVLAWEELYEGDRYIFYRNREIAGEAAVLQAYQYCGRMPYDTRVAIYGNGHTAKGALRVLHGLGADVDVYKWRQEKAFRSNLSRYDVLINCCMWDTSRTDRLIYRSDLGRLRRGAMIIDVSCDPELEIETSHPTTIERPVYTVDGILHYAVDNTPAMVPLSVTKILSRGVSCMLDPVIEDRLTDMMRRAVVIDRGHIVDGRIAAFRRARGLVCR